MGRPGPAAPLPPWENEFQRAVGYRVRSRGAIHERECLGGGLSCHRDGEWRVAGERNRLAAGQLSQDERPGRIPVGPMQVKAAQAGGAPGHYERTHDADRLARRRNQMRRPVAHQRGRQLGIGLPDQYG